MTPEPAQPAESPEARALHKRWAAACERHDVLLRTHPDVTHPAVKRSGQRCAALYAQLADAAIKEIAASTARPTERGAVERDRIAKAILDGWYEGNETWDHPRNDMLRLRAYWAADAVLALPATDQAAEVERVEFIARVLWADGQRRLKQGQSDLPRTRTDFRTAARALLDHPALATQPATGRTMSGEVDWRRLAKLAGEHGVRYKTNRGMEAFLAALQNGGE